MIDSIKHKICRWLGVSSLEDRVTKLEQIVGDGTTAAIDAPYRSQENTQIIIASRLGGGYVRILDIQLRDITELRDIVRSLHSRYAAQHYFVDGPPVVREYLRDFHKQ